MDLFQFLLNNWVLVLIALTSGTLLLWPGVSQGMASGVTPAAAVQMINRERAVVVDVSEPDEFAAGHVTGAKNIPLGDLEKRLPESVKNKTLPLILVCARGNRARKAVAVAKQLGYEKAEAIAGGLGAWKDASLPLEKA